MTISTSSSQITISTNGSQGPFSFPFVGVAPADITVTSITSAGSATPLLSSQYTLSLNTANPNSLWGVGGSVTLSSLPSTGVDLLIQRTLPLTQQTSVQNQGNYYAQVTEQALDLLCMEIQQVAARTTQFRGIWTTNTVYNVGDIVQDGANGADTFNYYICVNANTSGVWATDLTDGDWALSVLAVVPSTNKNITISGDASGSGTTAIPLTFNTVNSNVGSFTNANVTVNGKGLITAVANGNPVAGNTIGLVNKFRNGSMDVWQRGANGTVGSGLALYTADGWIAGASGGTLSWAQSTDLQTVSPTYYALKLTGAASMTDTFVRQRIQSNVAAQLVNNPGAVGAQVTAIYYVYNGTGGNLTPTLTVRHPTAKDNYASTVTDVSAGTMTTIGNMFEGYIAYTFTAANATYLGLEVTLDIGAKLNSNANTFYVTAADIRATPGISSGINLSPPTPELRPIGIEYPFCQEYFQTTYGNNVAPGTITTSGLVFAGMGTGSTIATWGIQFPVQMRAVPSVTIYDGAGTSGKNSEIAFGSASITNGLNTSTLPTNISNNSFVIVCNASSGNYTTFIHYVASSEL